MNLHLETHSEYSYLVIYSKMAWDLLGNKPFLTKSSSSILNSTEKKILLKIKFLEIWQSSDVLEQFFRYYIEILIDKQLIYDLRTTLLVSKMIGKSNVSLIIFQINKIEFLKTHPYSNDLDHLFDTMSKLALN